MLRSGVTFLAALVIWAVWRLLTPKAPQLIPGRAGLAVAALYGLGSITFITAVYNTSTANLVFILAFNTMFAALLSWIFLKERPRPATLLAMAAMVGGVLIIVGDSHRHRQPLRRLHGAVLGLPDRLGDHDLARERQGHGVHRAGRRGVSLRRRGLHGRQDRLPGRCAVVDHLQRRGDHAAVVLLPRRRPALHLRPGGGDVLPAGNGACAGLDVDDLYETPTRNSLIGGVILIVALVAHSLWQLADGRKRRAATAVRHPA